MIAKEKLRLWKEKPYIMVWDLFKVVPDPWQHDALERFPHQNQMAFVACKGPGKTALLAWCIWNFLLTRPSPCKVGVTAITKQNLKDNLWAELSTWRNKSPVLQEAFEFTSERIFTKEHNERGEPLKDEKFASFKTWSLDADPNQQANTWAGLHAPYVMAVLDESGGIPQGVMVAAQQIGTGLPIEWKVLQSGNPTHRSGPLYRAANEERADWDVTFITGDPDDPKRTPRMDIAWARSQIRIWGRDNPYVLVNIMGRFPPHSLSSLIGPDEVNAAIGRFVTPASYNRSARVLGIDVAREGDDKSVICPRAGLATFKPSIMRNVAEEFGAGVAAQIWTRFKADAAFIDNTGGWAGGWRVSLNAIGRFPIGVGFAESASDPQYYNKRAEIYFDTVKWIREGGTIHPDMADIVGELTNTTFTYKGDRILLEDKAMIKKKIGRSPDITDSLALTFSHPVEPSHVVNSSNSIGHAETEYDPHRLEHGDGDWRSSGAAGRALTEYDPYADERF